MAENGRNWLKMAKNGKKWLKMATIGGKILGSYIYLRKKKWHFATLYVSTFKIEIPPESGGKWTL